MFWKIALILVIFVTQASAQNITTRLKEPPPPYFKILTPFKMLPVEDVYSLHLLENYFGAGDNGVLFFRPKIKLTGIYRLKEGRLRYLKRMVPRAFIAKVTTLTYKDETRLAIGYEFHASEETKWKERQMVLFTIYDRELNKSVDIFERTSSTPKVNYLKELDGKLWINFFHEDGFSQGGYLTKEPDGWKFTKTFSGWKQDSLDINKDVVIVGSRYSDDQERAKELRMYKDRSWHSLPSQRGVNFVSFFQLDQDPELEIAISDGLPNSADKRGRPEIAYLDMNAATGEYKRYKIDGISRSQNEFKEITPFDYAGKKRLLVRGDLYIDLYTYNYKWDRERLYRRKDRNSAANLQALPLVTMEGKLAFVILDDTEVMAYDYLGK